MGPKLTDTHAQRAIESAARLHANLRFGLWPKPIAPGFTMEPGEVAHATFFDGNPRNLAFSRHLIPEAVRFRPPGHIVVGSPQFVTGYALASLVTSAVGHHRARRMSKPYWGEPTPALATLTNRRLHCDVRGKRLHFDYAATMCVQPDFKRWAVTLKFFDTQPLRLTGYNAPYVAVYIAHRVYGHGGAEQMPELARLL